jgi:hypothetical protein
MSAFGTKRTLPELSDFDLNQIQGRRAQTIVNDRLAFRPTGAHRVKRRITAVNCLTR